MDPVHSSMVAVAAVYGQLGLGVAAVTPEGGDPLDHVLAHLVGHPPEHHVLPVKPVEIIELNRIRQDHIQGKLNIPRSLVGGDEELRAVGVLAAVGHGNHEAVVLQDKVLVLEEVPVDAEKNILPLIRSVGMQTRLGAPLSPSAVVFRDVPALDHEVGDEAVEGAALVPEPEFPRAEGPEKLAVFYILCDFLWICA